MFVAFAALAAAGTARAASEASQEANAVVSLARQARVEIEARQNDQFADLPSHSEMVGKPFTVAIPVLEEGQGNSFSFVGSYDAGVLRFAIGGLNNTFSVRYVVVSTSRSIAHNAFGASVEVTSDVVDSVNMNAVDLPRGEAEYFHAGPFNNIKVKDNVFAWQKALSGPQAKAIYVGAKALVEGQFAAQPDDGKVINCGYSVREAKISNPHEIITKYCNIGVRIVHITFLSGDGTVLKDWRK